MSQLKPNSKNFLVHMVKVHNSGKLPAQQGSSHSMKTCPHRNGQVNECQHSELMVGISEHGAQPCMLPLYAIPFIDTVSPHLHLLLQ